MTTTLDPAAAAAQPTGQTGQKDQNGPSRLRRIATTVGACLTALINQMSMISLFIFGLYVAFLGVGHYLFYRMVGNGGLRDPQVPFGFFLSATILMIVYAWGYGKYCAVQNKETTPKFDGGYISARSVLRWMAIFLAFSCAAVGYEILGLGWTDDSSVGVWYLCGVPGTLVLFALVHGFYANGSRDLAGSRAWRFGTGRRTIVVLWLLTMLSFGYNIAITCGSLKFGPILWSMILFTGASILGIVTGFIYQASVTPELDQGRREG